MLFLPLARSSAPERLRWYKMALTVNEQKLFDAARAALPAWFFSDDLNVQELLGGFAKIFGASLLQADGWADSVFVLKATGAWLDQLARDRGTARQPNETDAALAIRLRQYQNMVTLPAISANIHALWVNLTGGGGTAPVFLELRTGRAFFGTQTASEPNPTHKRAWLSRGNRMGSSYESVLICILAYGMFEWQRQSIAEAIRQQKAGGVISIVELRIHP